MFEGIKIGEETIKLIKNIKSANSCTFVQESRGDLDRIFPKQPGFTDHKHPVTARGKCIYSATSMYSRF